jgi:hypothetical protein
MHVFLIFIGVHEIAALSWSFCIKAKGRKKNKDYCRENYPDKRNSRPLFSIYSPIFVIDPLFSGHISTCLIISEQT